MLRRTAVGLVTVLMLSLGFVTGVGGAAASGLATVGGTVFHTDLQSEFVGTSIHPSSGPAGSCGILQCYTPEEVQDGYNYGPAYTAVGGYANAGAGETIVIFDAFGDPTVASDLATFDATFGLPTAHLNIICPAGCPPFNPSSPDEVGWSEEITLDTQYSHAMAPAATLDLVIAHSDSDNDLAFAEQYALSHHLGEIWSQSFGTPECTFSPGVASGPLASVPWFAENNKIFQEAVSQGISVFASAGDGGAQDAGETAPIYATSCPFPSANYPADNPNNIAVTGTYLGLNFHGATVSSPLVSAPATYFRETTWNDFENATLAAYGLIFGVTGGAPSTDFLGPSYQVGHTILPESCAGATPSTCTAGRPVPLTGHNELGKVSADVAYDAGVDGGVLGYYSAIPSIAGFYIFGGTSAGSPQWAAITAIADQLHHTSLGNFAPLLYSLVGTSAFHDIQVGSNVFYLEPGAGFLSAPGWDAASGVGTPNVGVLVADL